MLIEEQAINTIKKLSLEMILRAGSGHCGAALDCAPILYSIYREAKVCPSQPNWINRDRIILSNGHASAALYATLHLMGYNITIDDLKDFRTLGSITPGHPEINTPGIDCTTGALGQGLSVASGLAVAETMLNSRYNTKDINIIDHYTYVVCGDGDLMEGVSYESFALAGFFKLKKLIVLYNKNNMTIDGPLNKTCTEDVKMRFASQGFNVLECDDNYKNIISSIKMAKKSKQPTLIICNTVIAKGTMYQNNPQAHSNPFNEKEVKKLVENWGLNTTPFFVNLDVYKHFKTLQNKGEQLFTLWEDMLKIYKRRSISKYNKLFTYNPEQIAKDLNISFNKGTISSVEASYKLLNVLSKKDVNLVGGSADLSKSTKSELLGQDYYNAKNYSGRNISFGVREFAMANIINGIALHGGLRGYCSTFLAFSDYMRPAIRLSAMMNVDSLFLLSHDSISLGQDGATHQPIEQLESLRLMPNLMVFRPADAIETKYSYIYHTLNNGPMVIALSKIQEPIVNKAKYADISKGGYIIARESNRFRLNAILVAAGSEIEVALRTKKLLEYKGYSVRVVSMPCRELFEKQSKTYIQSVLPADFPTKVVIEAGVTRSWHSVAGRFGYVVGVNTFGESGTKEELYDLFGVSAVNISNIAIDLIKRNCTN